MISPAPLSPAVQGSLLGEMDKLSPELLALVRKNPRLKLFGIVELKLAVYRPIPMWVGGLLV